MHPVSDSMYKCFGSKAKSSCNHIAFHFLSLFLKETFLSSKQEWVPSTEEKYIWKGYSIIVRRIQYSLKTTVLIEINIFPQLETFSFGFSWYSSRPWHRCTPPGPFFLVAAPTEDAFRPPDRAAPAAPAATTASALTLRLLRCLPRKLRWWHRRWSPRRSSRPFPWPADGKSRRRAPSDLSSATRPSYSGSSSWARTNVTWGHCSSRSGVVRSRPRNCGPLHWGWCWVFWPGFGWRTCQSRDGNSSKRPTAANRSSDRLSSWRRSESPWKIGHRSWDSPPNCSSPARRARRRAVGRCSPGRMAEWCTSWKTDTSRRWTFRRWWPEFSPLWFPSGSASPGPWCFAGPSSCWPAWDRIHCLRRRPLPHWCCSAAWPVPARPSPPAGSRNWPRRDAAAVDRDVIPWTRVHCLRYSVRQIGRFRKDDARGAHLRVRPTRWCFRWTGRRRRSWFCRGGAAAGWRTWRAFPAKEFPAWWWCSECCRCCASSPADWIRVLCECAASGVALRIGTQCPWILRVGRKGLKY